MRPCIVHGLHSGAVANCAAAGALRRSWRPCSARANSCTALQRPNCPMCNQTLVHSGQMAVVPSQALHRVIQQLQVCGSSLAAWPLCWRPRHAVPRFQVRCSHVDVQHGQCQWVGDLSDQSSHAHHFAAPLPAVGALAEHMDADAEDGDDASQSGNTTASGQRRKRKRGNGAGLEQAASGEVNPEVEGARAHRKQRRL